MKKIFLPILISIFCIPNLAKSQGICGTYDGYLQDEMNKYPAFYKSIEGKNIELEQKSKALISNLKEKFQYWDMIGAMIDQSIDISLNL